MSNLWQKEKVSLSELWRECYDDTIKRQYMKKRIYKKTPHHIAEERIEDIKFNVYKFSNKTKPKNSRRILIISCFSEFGCETIASLYCLPRIMKMIPI